jgi:hypothetical protein
MDLEVSIPLRWVYSWTAQQTRVRPSDACVQSPSTRYRHMSHMFQWGPDDLNVLLYQSLSVRDQSTNLPGTGSVYPDTLPSATRQCASSDARDRLLVCMRTHMSALCRNWLHALSKRPCFWSLEHCRRLRAAGELRHASELCVLPSIRSVACIVHGVRCTRCTTCGPEGVVPVQHVTSCRLRKEANHTLVGLLQLCECPREALAARTSASDASVRPIVQRVPAGARPSAHRSGTA